MRCERIGNENQLPIPRHKSLHGVSAPTAIRGTSPPVTASLSADVAAPATVRSASPGIRRTTTVAGTDTTGDAAAAGNAGGGRYHRAIRTRYTALAAARAGVGVMTAPVASC